MCVFIRHVRKQIMRFTTAIPIKSFAIVLTLFFSFYLENSSFNEIPKETLS